MTINKKLLVALVAAPFALGFAVPSFSAQPAEMTETQANETQVEGNTDVAEVQANESKDSEVGEVQDNENQATESGEQADGGAEGVN